MVKDVPVGGNIFLNLENLAFAMPLILLCSSYAYFKYLPWTYSLPGVGVVGLIVLVRMQAQARKEEKLTNLDEDMIKDIVGEEEEEDNAKAKSKKKGKPSPKKGKKNQDGGADDNAGDDDDEDLAAFAKGSRGKQKKK